jgi:hypothetical protein
MGQLRWRSTARGVMAMTSSPGHALHCLVMGLTMYSASMNGSFTATTSMSLRSMVARMTAGRARRLMASVRRMPEPFPSRFADRIPIEGHVTARNARGASASGATQRDGQAEPLISRAVTPQSEVPAESPRGPGWLQGPRRRTQATNAPKACGDGKDVGKRFSGASGRDMPQRLQCMPKKSLQVRTTHH